MRNWKFANCYVDLEYNQRNVCLCLEFTLIKIKDFLPSGDMCRVGCQYMSKFKKMT